MDVSELVLVIVFLSPVSPQPAPSSLPPLTWPSSSNSSSTATPAIPPIFSIPPRPNVSSPLPPPMPPLPSRVTTLHQIVSTVSTKENSWVSILSNWANPNKTSTNIERLLKGKTCPADSYSCRSRCRDDERRTPPTPYCFCDRVCSAYGDCCYDYTTWCSADYGNPNRNMNTKCLATDRSVRYGYIAVNSCPEEWRKYTTSALCMNNTTDDLLSELPVFDWNNFTLYKNVFCAFCNRAENISYWGLEARCGSTAVTEMNFHSLVAFVKGCNLSYFHPFQQRRFLKKCTPQEQRLENLSAAKRNLTTKKLCSMCSEYSMEWCFKKQRFRNPHCLLCQGDMTHFTESYCCQPHTPVLPPLSILFDFQSTTKYLIKAKTQRNTRTVQVEAAHKCSRHEVYDPFSDMCRGIHFKITSGNETSNCTGLIFKPQDYQLFSNGSVFIPSHGKTYDRGSYVLNGTLLVLCTNLTYNLSRPMIREESVENLHFLHLATYIGSAVSLVALVMLLLTYFCNSELRNLPGKITICLASSLLVSHVLYFVMNYSDVRPLCTTIGVLMHYWLLASFLWMNAMAVCVHGTFTNKVNVVRVGRGSPAGTFARYSIYAWITPLVIVGSCAIYDAVTAGTIYGSNIYCFIENKTVLLCTFVAPVGIIILFNFFALARTLHHLGKIQKETSETLSRQSRKPNLTVICLKMTSALGLTWVLGILAAFKHTAFLWYPFVLFNSLQGLFLFASFILNKRTLVLVRAKLSQRKIVQGSGLYLEGTQVARKKTKENTV